MIFVYPAVVSSNVDEVHLNAITKTLEMYFLENIRVAATSGSLRFYVTKKGKRNPKYSHIKIDESVSVLDDDKFDYMMPLMEGTIESDIRRAQSVEAGERKRLAEIDKEVEGLVVKLNKERVAIIQASLDQSKKPHEIGVGTMKKPVDVDEWIVKIEDVTKNSPYGRFRIRAVTKVGTFDYKYDETMESIDQDVRIKFFKDQIENLTGEKITISKSQQGSKKNTLDLEKEKREKDKKIAISTPGEATFTHSKNMDLTPTMDNITVKLRVKYKGKWEEVDEKPVGIPVGVKVMPIIIKDFTDIYSVLESDIYSNRIVYYYKYIWRNTISKVFKMFQRPARWLMSWIIPEEQFSVWRDVLISPKNFRDASSIFSRRSIENQKITAAVVIISHNDIKEGQVGLFEDPVRISRLFNMGWNHIGIMDDTSKKLIFCSASQRGMCMRIPYALLYKNMDASEIYKDIQDITNPMMNLRFKKVNFRALHKKLREHVSAQNIVRDKFDKYSEIVNG